MSDESPDSFDVSGEGDDNEAESPEISSPPSSPQLIVSSSPPSPQLSQGSDVQSLVLQSDSETTSPEPTSPDRYTTSPRDVSSPDVDGASPPRDGSSPTEINDEDDYEIAYVDENEEEEMPAELESSQDGLQEQIVEPTGTETIPVEYEAVMPSQSSTIELSQSSTIELSTSESDTEFEQDVVAETTQDEQVLDPQVLEPQVLEPQVLEVEQLSSDPADPDDVNLRAEQLSRQLQRREEELERLTAENRTLSGQLSSAINAICEAVLQAQQVATKEWQWQHKEKRLEQQMKMLQAHNRQMSTQLQEQGLELAVLGHNSESRIMRLKRQLDLKTDELRERTETSIRQSERLVEEQRRVEALLDTLREARDSVITLQEVHAPQQIQGPSRLAQLYQESRGLAEQLSGAVCELREALQDASQKYGELETNAETFKVYFQKQLEQRDKTIEALKQELRNANVLLEKRDQSSAEKEATIGSLAPAAVAARKLVLSGMTLTQLYSQYASISEELETKTAENLHLSNTLNTIIEQDIVTLSGKFEEALQQLADVQERESQHSRLIEILRDQGDHYMERYHQLVSNNKPTHEVGLSPMKFGMQVASSGVETSRQPREEVADSQEEAQGGATVVLVRPQEVSSSQSLQQSLPPPTSSQSTAPTLKRLMDDTTTTTSTRTEEPQMKQGRMEVSSASTEAEEEPSSSLHEAPDEVIIVDSGDDTEEEEEEEEEEERDAEEDDPEDAEVDYPEDEADENDDNEEQQDEEGEVEDEFPEDMEEEEEEEEEEGGVPPSPEQQQQDDDDDDVVILDDPPQLPRDLANLIGVDWSEPASSSATHLLDMPEIEDCGDEGESASEDIVGEEVSSPQEMQGEEPPVKLAPSHTSDTLQQEAGFESVDAQKGQTSASQVSSEDGALHILASVESVAEDVVVEPEADMPSSSISVPTVIITGATPTQQQQQSQDYQAGGEPIPSLGGRGQTPRGANRARRSGMRSRPSSRPTPIVWDHSQTAAPQQGVGRGLLDGSRGNTAARRSRGPRSGHSPFMRHF